MQETLNSLFKLMDPAKISDVLSTRGMSVEQSRAAFDALVPALGQAMRRRAADPRGLAEMMGLVKPKPDFAASMPGGEALGRLFGSRQLTEAVIDTVSKTSGVDRKVLEIALPLATEQTMAAFADTLKSHPLTETFAPLVEPKPRSAPTLEEILTDSIGPATSRLVGKALRETPNPIGPQNVFGEILGEFIRGFNNGGPPIDEELAPEDEVPPPGRAVGQLFEAGRAAQDEQHRALEAIFDRFWSDAAEMTAKLPSAPSA
jgi:hypothetical protein